MLDMNRQYAIASVYGKEIEVYAQGGGSTSWHLTQQVKDDLTQHTSMSARELSHMEHTPGRQIDYEGAGQAPLGWCIPKDRSEPCETAPPLSGKATCMMGNEERRCTILRL